MEQTGRLTLPTDADVVAETLRLKNLLGADALRDCDGTEMPKELLTDPAKKYATYYTTRKDNAWAEANPDEVQQEYLTCPLPRATSTTSPPSSTAARPFTRTSLSLQARFPHSTAALTTLTCAAP